MIDVSTVQAIINVVPCTDLSEYNFHPTDIVSKSDWKTEQENHPIIGPVINAM